MQPTSYLIKCADSAAGAFGVSAATILVSTLWGRSVTHFTGRSLDNLTSTEFGMRCIAFCTVEQTFEEMLNSLDPYSRSDGTKQYRKLSIHAISVMITLVADHYASPYQHKILVCAVPFYAIPRFIYFVCTYKPAKN